MRQHSAVDISYYGLNTETDGLYAESVGAILGYGGDLTPMSESMTLK